LISLIAQDPADIQGVYGARHVAPVDPERWVDVEPIASGTVELNPVVSVADAPMSTKAKSPMWPTDPGRSS